MKPLVEGQCGQSNALVGLSRNFTANNGRVQTGVDGQLRGAMPGMAPGEQFADEYLNRFSAQTAAPSTFNMKSLARNLPPTHRSSSASDLSNAWATDFAKSRPPMALSNQWSRQYMNQHPSRQSSASSVSTAQAEMEAIWQGTQQNAGFRQAQMWNTEYLDSFDTSSTSAKTMGDQWANQFLESESARQNNLQSSSSFDNVLKDYEQEWDNMMAGKHLVDDFDTEMRPNVDYIFQSNNPFINEENLANTAAEMLKNGNISEAVQYYEAAVQKDPQDANAWCQLGLALAENEQDGKAIAAFNKSLSVEPRNKEALLAMAVSMANESMENEALGQLEKWITVYTNPNDPHALTSEAKPPNYSPYSLLDQQSFQRVEQRFLAAAQLQAPQGVDPSLQNALGVLYNINKNFTRAIDSLKAAVATRPDDARLWNRLGATLANGDHTAEAISAYRHALTLFPTFVRARYNLGISCMHLKSYRDAVDHFLSALQIQKSPENSPIWSSMRSAVLRMDPPPTSDLIRALDQRNVNDFVAELSMVPRV
uniref:TPR_REGION domain-containing protein n=1 Tax=Panagrellus redivivus TaxID=6233 RepID=A0A7E4VAM0_PANRE